VETFASYAARWLAARELKPSTVREYTRMLRSLVSAFGDLPLDDIAAVDIRTWYARLDPAKKTARAHHYALLHTVLNSAVEEELIDVNPCHIRAAGVTRKARKISAGDSRRARQSDRGTPRPLPCPRSHRWLVRAAIR